MAAVAARAKLCAAPEDERRTRRRARNACDLAGNRSTVLGIDRYCASCTDAPRGTAGRCAAHRVCVRLERQNGRVVRVWNSLVAVDDQAAVAAVYDKHHLVPFGEYMPLRDILPLDKITAGALDFSAGPGPRTIHLPGLPAFSPLICYEIIFPGRVANAADRPSWLLNITNDAWFGASAGPHQHFASARLRAVEEGLPVVRAANTGISGVIDAYGRVAASLGLEQSGTVDSKLPVAAPDRTVFARFGNIVPGTLVLLMFCTAGAIRARISRQNK